MFRVRNVHGDWLMPVNRWYHGFPTFCTDLADAGTFTSGQADAFIALPRMHPGAVKVPV